MKIKVIVSKRIESAFNLRMKEWLVQNSIPYIEIADFPHYLEDSDIESEDAEFFVAIGIHSIADHPKQFCVHPAGNWGEKWKSARFDNLGGEKNKLSKTSAFLLKQAYLALSRNNNLNDYIVNLECTHHGPKVSKPLVFLEIGCSPEEWMDQDALTIIKNTLIDLQELEYEQRKTAIVLGGDHYMQKIQDIFRETDIQVSHMCPSSQIQSINKQIILEAINKSYEPIGLFLIDLAGVGQHKETIITLLQQTKQKYSFIHELI